MAVVQEQPQIFYASEIPNLNMSGLHVESIRDARINKYGQMVYQMKDGSNVTGSRSKNSQRKKNREKEEIVKAEPINPCIAGDLNEGLENFSDTDEHALIGEQ